MTQILSGSELVDFIMERQARQVRALRQASRIIPKLAVIRSTAASSVIDTYIRMKKLYGEQILIETIVETLAEADMPAAIKRLNEDASVHGIIVQLPLADPSITDSIVDQIIPEKDVDGLGKSATYDSATAAAINWLLAGYAIDLRQKKIVIVGNGRLVGRPLAAIWKASGYNVQVLDDSHTDIASELKGAEVIVSATGVPRLITSEMVEAGAVIVDAGTASESGVVVGDIDPLVRERQDIKITPEKGGVGPLTIALLFDHVIQSATKVAEQ